MGFSSLCVVLALRLVPDLCVPLPPLHGQHAWWLPSWVPLLGLWAA